MNIKGEMMKDLKKAFTLAEVLITLGIIGIVAALTIPMLMNNSQDAQLKTAWKKNYSVLSNATNLIKNDNGGAMAGVFTSGQSSMLSVYSNYLSVAKSCLTDSVAEGCIASQYYKGLDGTGTGGTDAFNIPGVILNDGTSIVFFGSVGNALNCNRALDTNPPLSQICGNLYIDVNGVKPPNVVGKDLFLIFITQTGAYAAGASPSSALTPITDFSFSCNPANTTYFWRGMGCSAMYLMQ